MKVRECMTPTVKTVPITADVRTAAETMRDSRVGFLPVVNLAGTPMGVLTDRDIVTRCVADGKPLEAKVSDVMTEEIYWVGEDSPVDDAVAMMKEKNVGRLVVTDRENRVTGVFSLGDAAIALGDHVIGNAVMDAVGRHSQIPASHPPTHV